MRFVHVALGLLIALPPLAAQTPGNDDPAPKKPAQSSDVRPATLEDIYGDTGAQFRGAVGFFTREPTSATPPTAIGYGVAIDDMVVTWKETRLDEDSHTHCASGGVCATIESATGASGTSYEGSSFVTLTVTDSTPYDPVNPKNDCNGDGDYTDAVNHCWKPNATTGSNAPCATIGAPCASGEVCFGPDSNDCNGNGTPDVTVKVTTDSPGEVTGEIAVLDRVAPGSPLYKGSFPYSTAYDSPGTLFVAQSGTQAPVIRALYFDRDDGTGSPCKNALALAKQGQLEADSSVALTAGRITVNSYSVNNVSTCSITTGKQCAANADCAGHCSITTTKACNVASECPGESCVGSDGICNSCSLLPAKPCIPGATSGSGFCNASQGVCTSTTGHGDPDGFADSNETIALAVQFANKSGIDVNDLTATIGTNSPNIECITRSAIVVGALVNGALSNTANYPAFQFKVANVNRTTVNQVLQATFAITMRSNKFDVLTRAESITLDLDLNATGNAVTSAFVEDFEAPASSGFGGFTLDTLEAGKNNLAASDGYRCQYNDPFGLNTNSAGEPDCFLGFTTDPASGVNDWHIHTTMSGGMGRAYTGRQSLHMGVHRNPTSPILDTYRFKQLVAVKTTNQINLPLVSANPELNFAQQISLVDSTSGVGVTAGEAPDRGVVEVQLAPNGIPTGNWIKIYPFANVYDEQGTDDFSNCTFDPIDDGNNEDSFFDPTDPNRFYGPSSTCYPEFSFVRQGQTDYRKTFDVNDIGNASDGPGLQGCSGGTCLPANTPAVISNPGTWVRPRFSLAAFAARSIRVRFLFTSIEVGQTQTYDLFFARGGINGDDGWYIDDVHIDQALSSALTLSVDTATITALPCGACTTVTAALTATPSPLSSPGQIVTLDARASTIDRCLNGIVQYQFWADANVNGVVGDAGDVLLRDWTDNSSYIDSPLKTTQYGVKARCSTDPSCDSASNSFALNVPVNCPSTGTLRAVFTQSITVNKTSPPFGVTIGWPTAMSVDAIRGNLGLLKSSHTFTGTVQACLATNSAPIAALTESTDPGAGNGFYYLVRGQTTDYCNQTGPGYTTYAVKETAGRDAQIDADPASATCP